MEYLDSYSDALMVIITAIYVLATIAICIANIISANAARRQTRETKQEYEETRRLEMMPYLQFESGSFMGDHYEHLALADEIVENDERRETLKITNIGMGTAKDILYTWTNIDRSCDKGSFPVKALRAGSEQQVSFLFSYPRASNDYFTAYFDLYYKDLLDYKYKQRIELYFCNKPSDIGLKEYITFSPEPIKENNHV